MSERIQLGSRELDALVRVAWDEARGEPEKGVHAVVATILNRSAANQPYFGGRDIISILNHPNQYQGVGRVGGVDRLPQPPKEFAAEIAEFVAGFSPENDPSQGATFFDANNRNPYQSHLTIAREGETGHRFYRGYDTAVDVPRYEVEVAAPALQTFGIEAPARTAQATQVPATGPILTDETSLLTPYADGGTARLSQIAGITPPARPTDLASRPDVGNRTLGGYDASLGQRGDVAQLQRGPELPGVRQAQLEYGNRGATRNQRLNPVLEARIAEAVGAVYGPDARAVVYSGGQPEGRPRPSGASPRHDDGLAADVKVFDADGNQIRGDRLGSLGQYWGAQGFGSVGMEMRTGGIHLDAHNANPERLIPGAMAAYGSPSWDYSQRGGSVTPGQLAAMERGFAGEMPRVYAATPPSPTQAVAARARNPANMTAFAEPPEPAQRPTRVAAAAPVTMTDVAQTARPAARQVVSSGMTPATAYAPASPPSTAPSRSAAPSYAPDVTQGMTRGNRFGDGALGLRGPESALAMRGATNLGGVTTSALPGSFGEFNDFSRLINTPQAQARTNPMGARSPRAMGAEDIAAPSAPSTFPARPAPGGPGAYPASAAARPVRTEIVAAVPGTIAGAFPAPAAPPSRPVAPPAPPPRPAPAPARAPAPAPALTTAPALAAAPLPPERPAFLPNNPNAPRGVQMFERGAAGIGNFVERNTRGLRSSLNERYGDYYGGNMFAPNYNTGNDIIDFINTDAALRGPGAPNLFDAYDRSFGNMSRGGRFGGSTIGGMVAGPPGALVGGLLGGIVGEQMGFGRDRREARQNESRSLLDAIGDFIGGLGGLGGTDLGGESRDSDNGSRRGGGFGTPEPGMGIGGDNWA